MSTTMAYSSGFQRGGTHAAYVEAYGSDDRPLAEILVDLRPGWVSSEQEIAEFADGFCDGMNATDDETADES